MTDAVVDLKATAAAKERADITNAILRQQDMAAGAIQYTGWIIDMVFSWLDKSGYEVKKKVVLQ